MNTSAVVMMVIAMLVLWGGLVLAILNISRTNPNKAGQQHRDQ